jgi:lipid II:glycine glycyltransferase (peptidoglycan interpeptide bridge formation enzyme)
VGGPDGEVLGGLMLYRHGGRLSTQHAADRAHLRRTHPGTMHLLRWRAIELALAEGRSEMDLGGVDLAGARRLPVPGEPTWGLYEHKRSFGAEWVALAGAQERIARSWRYAAGRAASRTTRAAQRILGS